MELVKGSALEIPTPGEVLRNLTRIGMEPPFKRRRIDRSEFTDEELYHRRARNDLRLKSAFESIFEKYGKDFTGIGDEIDLVTGKIVVNRGHLSSLDDEKNPGHAEDLFDELGGEIWSSETKATTKKGRVRPRAIISAFEDSFFSGLGTEMRDSSRSSQSPDKLMGDAKTAILASDTDELARLRKNKAFLNLGGHSPKNPPQAVENENNVEPKWRAPPLSDKVSVCEKNLQTQNVLSDAFENRSTSPPGVSLWGTSERGKKPRLARRTDSFTSLTKNSGLPLSPIKQARFRRSTMSLSYEWSEISINQASERSSISTPIISPKASQSICKSVSNLPWTKYEDHKLYYLRSEAGASDSELAAAFRNRSKTEIEERWLGLRLDDEKSLVHGARQENHSHAHSIDISDFADRRNDSFSIRRQPSGDQISPPPIETQPLRLSDTAEQQIFPVKPGTVERIPSTHPKSHVDSIKVPETTMSKDLAIDLTISDKEEETKNANSEHLTERAEHTSKQGEISVNRTKGILKRVTRKSAIFHRVRDRPLIKGKGALASDETDLFLYTEIPEVQNQILSDLTPRLVPSSNKNKKRRRCSIFISRAKRQKQLALKRSLAKVRNQRPSEPSNFVTPSTEIGTEPLPSSRVTTRSTRSRQILTASGINPHFSSSQQSKELSNRRLESSSPFNVSTIAKAQCTDSDSLDKPKAVSSDDGKSKSDQICKKCSSKITINTVGISRDDLLCSTCFSRESYRSRSLKRSTFLREYSGRKDVPNINNVHTELRNREDSEDVDCLLEALPVKIITPAKIRPQQVSSAPSSNTTHVKAMKTNSIPLRPRVIDDLSDDELAIPL